MDCDWAGDATDGYGGGGGVSDGGAEGVSDGGIEGITERDPTLCLLGLRLIESDS